MNPTCDWCNATYQPSERWGWAPLMSKGEHLCPSCSKTLDEVLVQVKKAKGVLATEEERGAERDALTMEVTVGR